MRRISKTLSFVLIFAILLSFSQSELETKAASISISSKNISINVGQTKTLKIKGTKKKVIWKSRNKKIATVSKKGIVKGEKVGSTKIIATVSKRNFSCSVRVVKQVINENNQQIVTQDTMQTPTSSIIPTVAPTTTPTPYVSPTPIINPTVTPTVKPSPTPTPTIASTPTPIPTVEPLVTPTISPTETPMPTVSPTPIPLTREQIVQENYTKLKKYIIDNGEINTNGLKYISKDKGVCKIGIVYDNIELCFKYIYYDDEGSTETRVYENNLSMAYYSFFYVSTVGTCSVSAMFNPNNILNYDSYKFTVNSYTIMYRSDAVMFAKIYLTSSMNDLLIFARDTMGVDSFDLGF